MTANFVYYGPGDRLQQTVNSATTSYTLDLATGPTQVLADGTNTYLYGVSRIAQYSASSPQYFLSDALGSVRQPDLTAASLPVGRQGRLSGSRWS